MSFITNNLGSLGDALGGGAEIPEMAGKLAEQGVKCCMEKVTGGGGEQKEKKEEESGNDLIDSALSFASGSNKGGEGGEGGGVGDKLKGLAGGLF